MLDVLVSSRKAITTGRGGMDLQQIMKSLLKKLEF